jgi:hypothetical protein
MISDEKVYSRLLPSVKDSAGFADRYWELSQEQRNLVSDLIEVCAEEFKSHILTDGEVETDLLADSVELIAEVSEEINRVRRHIFSFNVEP